MVQRRTPLRARSRVFLIALLAAFVSMFGMTSATANDLHERQDNYDSWSYIHDAGTSSEFSLGQGFNTGTAFAAQKVHHIAVWLQRTGAAENSCVWLTLRQYSNTGDLQSVCLNAQNMGTTAQWYDFYFDPPVTVTPNTQYNFLVRYYGTCNDCVRIGWSSTNQYRDSAGPNYRYGQSGTSCCVFYSGTDLKFLIAVDHSPVVTTNSATNVTMNSATLNGTNNDDGGDLPWMYFQYGTTTSYGSTTSSVQCNQGQQCNRPATGLQPSTTYNYRVCAQNNTGTQCGGNLTFTTPNVTTTPSSINFGSVNVGSTSSIQTVTVSATTSTTVSSVSSGGSHPGDFQKLNDFCSGATISASTSCTFQLRFAPSAVGSRSANVVVSTGIGSRTMTVSGTGVGVPSASVSPTSHNFGSVNVGSSSGSQTFTVTNGGSATLSVTGVSVGGTHSADFPKTSDGCTGVNVAPGSSCSFQVAFGPQAVGSRSATVSITSNASTQTVTLSGTGVGVPQVATSPSSLNFGSVVVGSSSTPSTVTVQNTGTGNLTVSGVSIGGTNSGDFAKTSDGCSGATIAPNATCTFSVTFTPSALGSRSGSASISSNAGTHTVPLSGTGAGAPQIDVTPTSYAYGSVNVGSSSTPTTFTVSNPGTATLSVTGVSVGGSNPGDFVKSNDTCAGASVPAGSSCTFQVAFGPTAVGSRSATVTVTSNAGTRTVNLSGTGNGVPAINVNPTSINYGTITVGTSATQTVTVSNNGSAALSVTSVTFSGTNPGDFSKPVDGCSGTSVAPGSSCTFQVRFTPSVLGARSATATVSSNAGNPTVSLSGNGGGTPAGSVSPSAVNLGTVVVGSSSPTTTVTLTSNGTSDLTVSSVTLGGTNPTDFVVSDNTCTGATLPAGSTCTFKVAFAPGSTGSKSATVTVATNAGNKTVSLSGTATAPAASVTPATISYGTVTVGTVSSPQTVTVTNTGTANLTVSTVTLSGTNASDFTILSNSCTGATVAPGATCTFDVRFAPGAAGARSATVTINTNAGAKTVALSGTGGVAAINVTPASLNFGYVGVDPSDPLTVSVSNTGSAPLSVTTLTVSGAAAADYTISADTCSSTTLAPGTSCTFDVTLEASVAGTRSASITVASNAGNRTVSLTGIGDLAGPVSAFTTANNGVVLPTQSVTGTVTDDRSGVDTVTVTFTPLLPTGGSTVQATLSCNATRRSCTWSAVVPLIPGVYTVHVSATDLAGNVEFPGQTITIVV